MADSTLAAIRKKVRRLTRSPSEQQISTADIDEYINTFVLYDFPQELRLFKLRTKFTFYTDPGTDLYETDGSGLNELLNFEETYTAVHKPIFIAGYESYLSQSEEEFYGLYPLTNTISEETTGDGASVAFTGTLTSIPVIKNNVLFTSTDVNGVGLKLYDDSLVPGPTSLLDGDGTGTINYETGAFSLLFATAPANGTGIFSNTIPYTAARPDTVLYFNNKFVVRPVPDEVYPIQLEVDRRPTELLNSAQSPDLQQWWELISYGASLKIFQDRTDQESAQEIMPEFKRQEALVLRRTLVQQSKERTATIYSDGAWIGYGSGWGSRFGQR